MKPTTQSLLALFDSIVRNCDVTTGDIHDACAIMDAYLRGSNIPATATHRDLLALFGSF